MPIQVYNKLKDQKVLVLARTHKQVDQDFLEEITGEPVSLDDCYFVDELGQNPVFPERNHDLRADITAYEFLQHFNCRNFKCIYLTYCCFGRFLTYKKKLVPKVFKIFRGLLEEGGILIIEDVFWYLKFYGKEVTEFTDEWKEFFQSSPSINRLFDFTFDNNQKNGLVIGIAKPL